MAVKRREKHEGLAKTPSHAGMKSPIKTTNPQEGKDPPLLPPRERKRVPGQNNTSKPPNSMLSPQNRFRFDRRIFSWGHTWFGERRFLKVCLPVPGP